MSLKISKRGGKFWVRGTVDGRTIYQTTGADDEREAKLFALDLEKRLLSGTASTGSFDKVSDAIGLYRKTRNPKITDEYTLANIDKAIGKMPLSSLTTEKIARYGTDLWPGRKPGTVSRNLTTFRAVLNLAAKSGMMSKAPHVALPKHDDSRDRVLTEAERTILLKWLDDPEPGRLAIKIAYYSGARLGEVMMLRWGQVVEPGQFVFETSKGGLGKRKRSVPIHPAIGVAPCVGREREFVVDATRGDVRRAWNRFVRDNGIEDLRIHDLRHDFATRMAAAGADLDELARLLGHADLTMVMRYKAMRPNRLRDLIGSI